MGPKTPKKTPSKPKEASTPSAAADDPVQSTSAGPAPPVPDPAAAADVPDIDDVSDDPNEKRKRNLEPFHDCFFLVRCPITEQGKAKALIEESLRNIEGVEIASATN